MFQSKAYTVIYRADKVDTEERVREKLRRWKLEEGKDMRVLRKIASDFISRWDLVSPTLRHRIKAAMPSLAWNRWAIGRRFQIKTPNHKFKQYKWMHIS